MKFHQKIAWFVTLIFVLMSVAFLARGLQQILLPNSATQAKDLHTNWTEMQLVLHRQSPYGNVETASPYPPWTFPANVLLYWPPWSLAKVYYAFVNLACVGLLAGWAWKVALRHGAYYALVVATSVTAFSSIATGLGLGQNAIVYTTFLVGALVSYQGGWHMLCGILLGIAMSKINIALPFILPFIFRKDWKVVAAAAAYMLGATLFMAFWLHSPPLEMMNMWVVAAQRNNGVPYGPASLLTCVGVPADMASRSCAVVVLTAAVVTLAMLRKLPILVLFGLAAGFARLWTYHRVYDNIMLAFLLVGLADLYLRTRLRSVGAAWLLVGMTLWYPIRIMDVPVVHLIHVIIWVAGMIILALLATRTQSDSSPVRS